MLRLETNAQFVSVVAFLGATWRHLSQRKSSRNVRGIFERRVYAYNFSRI